MEGVSTPKSAALLSPPAEPMAGAYKTLLLFVVVYCARPEDWIPGLSIIPLGKVTGIAALVAFVFSFGSRKRSSGLPREMVYLLLLFGQFWLASIFSPVWKGGAIQKTIEFGKVVLVVGIMTLTVTSLTRLRKLLFVQAISVAAVTFISLAAGHYDRYGRLQGMLNGFYSNSNDLALAIVLSVPYCLVFFLTAPSRLRQVAWGLATLILAYGVVRTGSRGGLVAAVVVIAVCLWEFGLKDGRRYLVVVAAVIGLGILAVGGGTLRERLLATVYADPNSKDAAAAYASAQGRQENLIESIVTTIKHPLFGVGPGDFAVIAGDWHVSHNAYTQISSEAGLPGLVLFLMVFGYARSSARQAKRLAASEPSLRMTAVATSADLWGFAIGTVFFPVAYHFFSYFLVAYAVATLQIAQKVATASQPGQGVGTVRGYAYAQGLGTKTAWSAS